MTVGLTVRKARAARGIADMPDYTRSRRIDPEGWPRQVPTWQKKHARPPARPQSKSGRLSRWVLGTVFAGAIALILALALL